MRFLVYFFKRKQYIIGAESRTFYQLGFDNISQAKRKQAFAILAIKPAFSLKYPRPKSNSDCLCPPFLVWAKSPPDPPTNNGTDKEKRQSFSGK